MNYGEYMTDESHDLEFDREVRYQKLAHLDLRWVVERSSEFMVFESMISH